MALLVAGVALAIATVVGTFRDHLDDRPNRQHEFSSRIHFAIVLGLAVGRVGHPAQHSHHRYRQSRVAAHGAVAPDGQTVGRLIHLATSLPLWRGHE